MFKIIYGLLMLLVCTTSGCVADNEPDGPKIGPGDLMPDFSVVMNNGETVSSQQLKGKVAVIVFFNTACKDCQQELPIIQQLWDFYDDNPGVEIVLIAREESEASISAYWTTHGFTMPYSPQEDRKVYSLFAPSVIPRIYIANPEGVVTAAYGDTDMPTIDTLISDIEKADPALKN